MGGLLCICVLGILCRDVKIFCLNLVLWYYLFYILGAAAKKWKIVEAVSDKRKGGWILFAAAVYGGILALTEKMNFENYLLDIVFALLGSGICYGLAVFLEKKQGIIKRFLVLAGRYSLQFYLLNGYLLVAARVFLIQILGSKNVYLIYIGIVLSNLIAALIASKIIEKSKILSWIFGLKVAAK